MSIKQITIAFAGEVNVHPQIYRIICDDSFAAITAANYLSSNGMGFDFRNGDVALVIYGSTPVTQFFVVSKSSTTITLLPITGQVTLPVTGGDFAIFNGATGALEDLGYLPSDPTKTNVVMLNKSVTPTVNNMTVFSDTAGTVKDAGARILSGTTPTFGGGSASNAFTITGMPNSAHGSVAILTSTNSVSVLKAVPSLNTLTVTFSGDPGANTTLSYIYASGALN